MLDVVVKDGRSGHLLSAAEVELGHTTPRSDRETIELERTDGEGRLRVSRAPGELRIVAWKGDLAGGPHFLELAAGTHERVELVLHPTHSVAGVVRDHETGLPVEEAEVTFWTFSERDRVLTAQDGSFRHRRFPASEFAEQIHVRASGYGATVLYLRIEANGTWELPDPLDAGRDLRGTGTPWVEVALVPEVRVSGRAADVQGRPLAGATVSAEGYFHVQPDVASRDAAEETTDEDGAFSLDGLRSDIDHTLVLAAPGFAETLLELSAGERRVELGIVTLEREALLAGHLVDPDGYPVEDATVRLHVLDARDERPTGWPDGSTPPDLNVDARFLGHAYEARTMREGTFVFEGLREVAYRLVVARDAEPLIDRVVEPLSSGGFGDVALHLPPETATLRGRVAAPLGEPGSIPQTIVEIRRGGWTSRVTPDAGGRFRIAGLDERAPYRLTLRRIGETNERATHATVWAHEEPLLEPTAPEPTPETTTLLAQGESR